VELSPPAGLRARVLTAAEARRPAGRPLAPEAPVEPLVSFRRQVDTVRRLLGEVPPAGWHRPARPYPWTVHGLVGHLVGVERYLGGRLGLWPFDPVCAPDDHVGLTEPFVARTGGADPHETVAEWTALVGEIGSHLDGLGPDALDRPIAFHGYPFSVGSMLVARTFELWTHADDLRRALGRPLETPSPGEIAAIADLSLRNLFSATLVTAPHQSSRSARIVLTGPGGGVWRVGAPAGEPDVRVVADVVDYCRMVARRLTPEALGADVTGDADLARDLYDAARLLAA
jgi:uncharacterized protein (TIGR03083 family)